MPSNPETRDELFAKKLREIAGLLYSRFESFTIARQLLGRKEDVDKVIFCFDIKTSCIVDHKNPHVLLIIKTVNLSYLYLSHTQQIGENIG